VAHRAILTALLASVRRRKDFFRSLGVTSAKLAERALGLWLTGS
jgi:hypothetical protein